MRAGLQRLGVGPGDRVAAYLPNIPETLIAFIATASLGAIWAACAPEFGAAQRDRPLRADRAEASCWRWLATATATATSTAGRRSQAIRARLTSLEHVVSVPYGDARAPGHGQLGGAARRARAARVRAGRVRPPAVRAVLLGHDRPAEGDRPRPRRTAARAPQEPGPQLGPEARWPAAVVLRRPRG